MYICGQCGKEVLFSFAYVCCFCRKTFCSEHGLAENHRCPHMPYVIELEERKKLGIPKARYRCGYVLVYFPATGHLKTLIDRPNSITNWSHALNCFNTTDCGLIFVEPQEDEIVVLECGKPYWDRKVFSTSLQ
ncbi:hypothetical protein GWO13_09665 [Candidatus Bathyarchaeota archaeon]|nr:hypothetical protein [Candidatus Bathyarchaeota archaeon]